MLLPGSLRDYRTGTANQKRKKNVLAQLAFFAGGKGALNTVHAIYTVLDYINSVTSCCDVSVIFLFFITPSMNLSHSFVVPFFLRVNVLYYCGTRIVLCNVVVVSYFSNLRSRTLVSHRPQKAGVHVQHLHCIVRYVLLFSYYCTGQAPIALEWKIASGGKQILRKNRR